MTRQNLSDLIDKPVRYRGFASLDALASMVPLLLMIFLLFQASSSLARGSEEGLRAQQRFDKLVSVADYTVKSGAVVREGGLRYLNWVDEGLITEDYIEGLRQQAGLDSLYIRMEEPEVRYPVCIYRIVVSGQGKAIGRLFVCGG
jgi:hypothetical protein